MKYQFSDDELILECLRRVEALQSHEFFRRWELMLKRVEDGLVEIVIESPRDPRPRYKITEKGLEHYQKTGMISDHLKELRSLSRDELERRLMAYKFAEAFNRLPIDHRLSVLEELAKKGDSAAAQKLKAVNEGLEELRRFEKEVAEAPPDRKFEVLMKWRRELNRSKDH